MKLKDKLDLRRKKSEEDVMCENFSKKVEEMFLSQNAGDIIPGCRIVISYLERTIGRVDYKDLCMQMYKTPNQYDSIGRQEVVVTEEKFFDKMCWGIVKKWAENFCYEQGMELEIMNNNAHVFAIIYN